MDILIKKLKSLSSKATNQAAYLAYDKSESFKKPVDMIVVEEKVNLTEVNKIHIGETHKMIQEKQIC